MKSEGAAAADAGQPETTHEPAPRGGLALPLWLDSLPFRVAALLSVALLPLGIIALAQTQRSMKAAQDSFVATLQAQTAQIGTPEREAIMMAAGLAQGLGDTLVIMQPDAGTCSDLMARARDNNAQVSFAAFIEPGSISRCNSRHELFDFSDNPSSVRLFVDPRPDVTFDVAGEVSNQAVIVASHPVYDAAGELLGIIAISLPIWPIDFRRRESEVGGPGMFMTFNRHGEILTTDGTPEDITGQLPADLPLKDLTGQGAITFEARALDGTFRTYSVVPIVSDRAYALGSWERNPGFGSSSRAAAATLAFPILMWIVSLVVALLAINRLVLRHVRNLGQKMRSFAEERVFLAKDPLDEYAPIEFREINRSFDQMVRKIERDEADLENVIFERDVLFKELYHRVKNNLQLMSSIMNMQIRRARSDEARSALRGVQERITGLAAVHSDLYQSPGVSQVHAEVLLKDLIEQLLVIGIARESDVDVDLSLEPVFLVPDQAAPLALLTTEAVTNALKYMARDAEGRCFLSVSLRTLVDDDAGGCELLIVNSISSDPVPDPAGSGLGHRLIDAFVAQLGGTSQTVVAEGRYTFSVQFVPAPFEPIAEN